MKKPVFSLVALSCYWMLLSCPWLTLAQTANTSADRQTAPTQASATYRVGLKSIVIPAPADLKETGPDYRVVLEPAAPVSNRLIAAFLPPQDIAKLPNVPPGGFLPFAVVQTLREAEFVELNEADFKETKESIVKQAGAAVNAPAMDVKDVQDEVNKNLKAVGHPADVTMGKPTQLGIFFSKPNAIGFGMMLDMSVNGKTTKGLIVSSIMRVQNRLLYTFVSTELTGDDSVAWARTVSEAWVDAILKANP